MMKYCPQCASPMQQLNIDNAKRYQCTNENCSYMHWNNPIPVVAALVRNETHYIIARNVKWPKGIFSVISGYLEAGEDVESAVLREVKEELGLDGKIKQYLGHYTFKEKNQLLLAYEVVTHGTVELNHELAEFKQLSAEELAAYKFKPLYITQNIVDQWLTTQNQTKP